MSLTSISILNGAEDIIYRGGGGGYITASASSLSATTINVKATTEANADIEYDTML